MMAFETIIGIIIIAGLCLALFIFFRKPGENSKDALNMMRVYIPEQTDPPFRNN